MTKPPRGLHSTKGIGRYQPNSKDYVTKDGVLVPCGTQVDTNIRTDLLYNEYIV